MHDKLAYLIKHVPFIQLMYRKIMSAVFQFLGLFLPVDKKLVLLTSYGGKNCNDSPKVLFDAMKADRRFDGYRYVWAFEYPEKFQVPGARVIKMDSMKYFKTALQAGIWITNVNIERGLRFKKKGTVYLNTWHGTGPKKAGNSVAGRKDYDFSNIDILCCDGPYLHEVYVNSFRAVESSILWCGRPREDRLYEYTEADRKKIREKLGVPADKKMILYMPTWREYGNRSIHYRLWEETLGEGYCFFIRSHHFAGEEIRSDQKSLWHDVTDYPDVNDLYCAADVLISDYSSAPWDYSILGKPVFWYAYDYDRFTGSTGLYFDMRKEMPGSLFETEETLLEAIRTMDEQAKRKETKAFFSRYVDHKGGATKACLDRLAELLK